MWPVRERITFFCRFTRERFDVLDFKSEMSEIRTNDNRATRIEFANLDFFIASGRFKKNQLGPAAGGVPASFLQPEHIPVERDGFFQVSYAIAGVEKLFDHLPSTCALPNKLQTLMRFYNRF